MNFKQWITSFQHTGGPRGDLAQDIVRDKKFPEDLQEWKELRVYLKDRGACREAMNAARYAWKIYQQQTLQF